MIRMIREILDMFRREKLYLFLLIAIISFYAIFFLLQHKAEKSEPEVLDPGKQKIEQLLRDAPQNAQQIEEKLTGRPRLKMIVQLFSLFFLSSFAYGIWLGTIDLKKLFYREELITHARRRLHIAWGIADAVKALILFVATAIALNLVVLFLKMLLHSPVDPSNYLLFHAMTLDLSAVGIMIALVHKSGAKSADLFGFRPPLSVGDEIWWGIRTYFLILPIFICILLALVYVSNLFSYEPPPHPLVEVLLQDEQLSGATILFSLFLACAVGPVIEEVFFRGFFYPALKKYVGRGWAMTLTAALFAGVHENLFSFLPIFFLGLALCYLYEKRNNLVSCVTLHIVHNSAFIIYFFIMKSVLLSGG